MKFPLKIENSQFLFTLSGLKCMTINKWVTSSLFLYLMHCKPDSSITEKIQYSLYQTSRFLRLCDCLFAFSSLSTCSIHKLSQQIIAKVSLFSIATLQFILNCRVTAMEAITNSANSSLLNLQLQLGKNLVSGCYMLDLMWML